MKTINEYVSLLRDYRMRKATEYGITDIGIFGSVARGEQHAGSDVDVYVTLERPDIFRMVHIKEELQRLFLCPVDIVRMHKNMDALLRSNILQDGIPA